MNCPKCGSYKTDKSETLTTAWCASCGAIWTVWQQQEIDRLKRGQFTDAHAELIGQQKAEIDKLQDVPLCSDHAQTWFTARNELHSKTGCVFCDLEAEIDRLKKKVKDSCWETPCELIIQANEEISRLLGLLKEIEEIPRQATIIKDATTITTYCSNCERAAAIAKRAREK